jgi:hypothetical protein
LCEQPHRLERRFHSEPPGQPFFCTGPLRLRMLDTGYDGATSSALTLVRALLRRYRLALLAVAVLLVGEQIVIPSLLVRQSLLSPTVNLAMRQRMLSQKVTKEALAIATGVDADPDRQAWRRSELEGTLKQWTAAHQMLLNGSLRLGFDPLQAPEVVAELAALAPSMTEVRAGVEEILHSGAAIPLAATLARLLAAEEDFLPRMEKIVALIERAAQHRIRLLRAGTIAITGLALGIMASAYWGVFQPAAKMIRQQQMRLSEGEARHRQLTLLLAEAHNELEERVLQRTLQLRDANQALQSEIAQRQAFALDHGPHHLR